MTARKNCVAFKIDPFYYVSKTVHYGNKEMRTQMTQMLQMTMDVKLSGVNPSYQCHQCSNIINI